MINSLTGYCEFFETEDEAINHCLKVNQDASLCVIDGPDDNYAVVDIESAEEILEYPDSRIPYLIVTK